MRFTLDARLEADSTLVTVTGLCQLRLMNDARWPWLLLVPQRHGVSEIFDLTPLDQTVLTFETALAGKALKQVTDCEKINVAALGNQVPQLHVHVVARFTDDPAWPGPVWGVAGGKPYGEERRQTLIESVLSAL